MKKTRMQKRINRPVIHRTKSDTYAGKWNNLKCNYKHVLVKIEKAKPETNWQNQYIGQERRCILVFNSYTNKQTGFIIDNEDGTGIHKIKNGGTPNFIHRSVTGTIIRDLFVHEVESTINVEKALEIEDEIMQYYKDFFPEVHKRLTVHLWNQVSK